MNISEKPEGATHWDSLDNDWVKQSGVKWYYWEWFSIENPLDGRWVSFDPSNLSIADYTLLAPELPIVKYQGEKPTLGSEQAAGYDVRASEDVTILPHQSGCITVNTRLEPPLGYAYLAMPRSSICNLDIMLKNSVGLIDNDYRGYTKWNFYNYGSDKVVIKKGDRIGQFVFFKTVHVDFVEAELNETARGAGGFGSTGV